MNGQAGRQHVGYSYVSGGQDMAAFVYDAGTMTRLETVASPAGWTLNGAIAINDSHSMVAIGIHPNGDHRAVIVTPEGVVPPGAVAAAVNRLSATVTDPIGRREMVPQHPS